MCDTMVTITDDGVLFAKNSDRDANEAQVLRWYAGADHAPGEMVDCTWSSIPQVARTHAAALSQPWWMWGAEMGANEHGVVIGNEAVFTRRTGTRGGSTPRAGRLDPARGAARRSARGGSALLGMDLLRLALERGANRREAVEVIVTLLERHGQGGSCSHEHPRFSYDNSFIVADPDGATVLETAGRHWATEEVVRARSISNGLTIPAFATRYADQLKGRVAACEVRRERTTRSAQQATDPADLMRALRDHGDQQGPRWSRVNGALSAPCAHAGGLVTSTQSTASWVADLRPARDGGGLRGGRHWVTATSAPCTGVFKPVEVHSPVPHDPEGRPANRHDPAYLWWRHERLHRLALRDLSTALQVIGPERDALEAEWLASPPDSSAAFDVAAEAEDRWREHLLQMRLPDLRPAWVRRLWAGWDRAAGIGSSEVVA